MAEPDAADLLGWPADDLPGLVNAIDIAGRRRLPVPGTLNFRDTGGYPLVGGGVTAWGRLLRSDALNRTGPAAAGALGRLGLRTVIDLRTSYEADIAPSPDDDLAALGAVTMHVSLLGADLSELPATLGAIYDFIIGRQGQAIGAAIRCLARPRALPALVHCTAGKDRTGIVVAIALAAVGVPDHIVAADYALTSRYLDPAHTPAIGQIRAGTGLGDRLTAELMVSPPELITELLAQVRQRAGSIAGYLASHGVSEAELGALRAALVTGD